MVPYLTMATSVPLATLIFQFPEHGLCVVKWLEEWVMWPMAHELTIYDLEKQFFKTLRE